MGRRGGEGTNEEREWDGKSRSREREGSGEGGEFREHDWTLEIGERCG